MKQIDLLIRSLGKFCLWLNATLSFAFIYLPIFILVIYSFNDSRFNAVWRGLTLKWYDNLLQGVADNAVSNVMIWDALKNSLFVATISTLLATIFGTMIALALERFRFPGRNVLEAILFLPIIIPEITIG
ncbi:MAG: spermidine/putrescine ABC transporter permease PotC, partial [Trichodesmium sp. MAG_R03]|nr:spermidine/putrescine ABC transporter permease PotC [Trichodesmium sp. MAG_R03]